MTQTRSQHVASLLPFLADPVDGQALQSDKGTLKSKHQTYPMIENIPWLFPHPDLMLGDWKNRYDYQDAYLASEVEQMEQYPPTGSSLAQKRVRTLKQARVEQRHAIRKILAPFLVHYSNHAFLHEAMATQLPETQTLMSYYPNIFRDWVWGDEENERSAAIVSAHLPSADSMLVLGAGAGRLAADLHKRHQLKTTILSELNPFLGLCGQRLLQGKSLRLYEFPVAPLQIKDLAVQQKLMSPYGAMEGIHYVFSDALNPPFRERVFDVILTPWFIDIVPMDLRDQILALNGLLEKGKIWLNFGTFVVHNNNPYACYSEDELGDLLKDGGFKLVKMERTTIPYLNSPHSAQKRQESVLTFSAEKVEDRPYQRKPFHILPEWITDDHTTIPELPSIQNMILTNYTFAKTLSTITEGATIQSLAETLSSQLQIPVNQTKGIVRAMLTKVYRAGSQPNNF